MERRICRWVVAGFAVLGGGCGVSGYGRFAQPDRAFIEVKSSGGIEFVGVSNGSTTVRRQELMPMMVGQSPLKVTYVLHREWCLVAGKGCVTEHVVSNCETTAYLRAGGRYQVKLGQSAGGPWMHLSENGRSIIIQSCSAERDRR